MQKPSQRSAACERIVEMQLIDPPHRGQIGGAGRTRQAAAPPADAELLRLPAHWQVILTVDHRLALRRPALPTDPSKQRLTNVSSPILAGRVFSLLVAASAAFFLNVGVWFRRVRLAASAPARSAAHAALRQKFHLSRHPESPSHLCLRPEANSFPSVINYINLQIAWRI